MTRREHFEERLQREQAELLRRHLAELRAEQRGPVLPPLPSAGDRARYDRATPAVRARASVLLEGAGFTSADIARGEALLRAEQLADAEPVDDLSRARARVLLRGRS